VSLCEFGEADQHQVARIGIATVARDAESCRRVIAAVRAMADTLPDAWLTDSRSEVISFGAGGDNLRDGIESYLCGGPDADPDRESALAVPRPHRKERE